VNHRQSCVLQIFKQSSGKCNPSDLPLPLNQVKK
jgi:hypothetical protein